MADEWRADATGYAGDPNARTPNLDGLARESQNFRNAVSVCPVCTPHRAALMTGRYPTTTGMFMNDIYLPANELCMAEILGAAGYSTGFIGKWHLDGHGRTAFVPAERRQGWAYWKAGECDHDYLHSHYYEGDSAEKRFWEGYDAFAQTRDAQQFIRDHAGSNQPFMLFLSLGPPHFPFDSAPEELKALFPPDKIKLPPNVPPTMQDAARKAAQGYYAHCLAVDRCIGDLLDTLSTSGLSKDTIFVFSSDHGETLGSHGVRPANKQVAWSDSAGVPLLVRVPAIKGRAIRTPITTPDVLPTLLGLAGVGIPASVEGEDLSPLIRARREKDRAALYMAVSPFMVNVPAEFNGEYRAIRTNRYTFVRGLGGPMLMYDDRRDLYQTNNLVDNPKYRGLVSKLDARLDAALADIHDDFRSAGSYVADWGYRLSPRGEIPYKDSESDVQSPRRNSSGTP